MKKRYFKKSNFFYKYKYFVNNTPDFIKLIFGIFSLLIILFNFIKLIFNPNLVYVSDFIGVFCGIILMVILVIYSFKVIAWLLFIPILFIRIIYKLIKFGLKGD